MLLAFSSYITSVNTSSTATITTTTNTTTTNDTNDTASTAGIIVGAIGGAVALLIALCIIIRCVVHCYKKKRASYGKGHITPSPISFHNSKATNHYASDVYELSNMTSSITGINLVDARTCK